MELSPKQIEALTMISRKREHVSVELTREAIERMVYLLTIAESETELDIRLIDKLRKARHRFGDVTLIS